MLQGKAPLVKSTHWPYTECRVQDRFDHHCPVVGNCVAVANHRFFVSLLAFGQLSASFCLAGVIWRLRRLDFPRWGHLQICLHVHSPGLDHCSHNACLLRSDAAWGNGEVYVLFLLGLLYFYNTLLLLFVVAHCGSILCGEHPLFCVPTSWQA